MSERKSLLQQGFTLIELLFVITIIASLMAVTAVGVTSAMQAQRLNASATRFASELNAIQLRAVRENRDIEVRFLYERNEFEEGMQIRGIISEAIDPPTGNRVALGEALRFEDGIIAVNNLEYSALLHHPVANAAKFTFRANGSTSLPKDDGLHWSMTLIQDHGQANLEALPANYKTVLVNAHTGTTTVY